MAKTLYKYSVVEAQNASLGQAGLILIDDTNEHTGPFVAIQALEDSVVDVSECDMSFIEDVVDFTIPAGMTIYGNFASIELDSGKVLAYHG
jgi:uncharacterized protein YcgI (DUF1989 family)|tara:strand:- start:6707 stop:6979 length:273 start_codon:yes stop_codon:yes gene_type:complete